MELNLKENFKDIPGFEGFYQVSNLGNVKSLHFGKEKILTPILNSNYYSVNLWIDGKRKKTAIHVLVACTFLNHCRKSGLVVDHIDNNPLNNKVENLQVVSKRVNSHKDMKQLYSKHAGVSYNKINKKYVSQIYYNNKLHYLGYFKNERIAAAVYQYNLLLLQNGNERTNIKLLKRTRKISN